MAQKVTESFINILLRDRARLTTLGRFYEICAMPISSVIEMASESLAVGVDLATPRQIKHRVRPQGESAERLLVNAVSVSLTAISPPFGARRIDVHPVAESGFERSGVDGAVFTIQQNRARFIP
jgi:hypothetical protein